MKGLNCELYTFTSESGYEIPSPLYYSNSANLVLQSLTLELANPFLVLITTSNPPVLLNFAAICTHYLASGSNNSALIILAVTLGLSIPAIFVILIVALFCKKRAHKRREVAQEFSIVPPSYPQETQSDLDPAFPVHKYSTLRDPLYTTCIVCMDAFTGEAEVRTLPCGHIYHKVCLEELFRRMRKCGICNREYPSGTKETIRLFLLTDVLRTEPNESILNVSSP